LVNLINDFKYLVLNQDVHLAIRITLGVLMLSVVVIFILLLFMISSHFINKSNLNLNRLIKSRKGARKGTRNKSHRVKNNFVNQVLENNKLSLERGGAYSESTLAIVVIYKWLFTPLCGLLIVLVNYKFVDDSISHSMLRGTMTMGFMELVIIFYMQYKISIEVKKFRLISYKLIKSIRLQMSAGLKVTEALNSLHTIPDDKILRSRLLLMSSRFASTNNIEDALSYITDYYQSLEAKTLALAIKQSIETGSSDRGYKLKEKKMFNNYINIIKKNTQMVMMKYIGIAILYGVVIIILVGYPQWLDLVEAKQVMFGK